MDTLVRVAHLPLALVTVSFRPPLSVIMINAVFTACCWNQRRDAAAGLVPVRPHKRWLRCLLKVMKEDEEKHIHLSSHLSGTLLCEV